ncbi:hypothetical protein GJAV_G00008200 [Gymnothorax javanicus]|nr:hypothetical protein GJAV_G00008200 [Gymnothorax javanicus]
MFRELRKHMDCEDTMSSPSSQKVLLNSTTKVSLNERFTNMLKSKQPVPANIRATMQLQHMASACNRRLAQLMEHRPSVQAALHQKQSLKQRLGKSNIQARLGKPIVALGGGVAGQGFPVAGHRGKTRGVIRNRGGRGGTMFLGGTGQMHGCGGPTVLAVHQGLKLRGGYVGRGRTGIGRGAQRGFVGKGRWGRGSFGGWGQGRGQGRGLGCPTITRELLDDQLDAYMAKTKRHLDAELDAYMAQTDVDCLE